MAELPVLGEHCAVSDCHQLDFLPVICQHCSRSFCRDHAFFDAHACTQAPCHAPVSAGSPPKSAVPMYPCSVPDCSHRELVPIQCSACEVHICLTHRHPADHHCVKYQPSQATMVQTQALVQDILRAKPMPKTAPARPARNLKAQKLAAKVQLMKLKMKSRGAASLPLEERLYFRVFLPLEAKKDPVGVFVSQKWSLGRVIDAVAETGGVDNRNNVDQAPKLRLFRFQDGTNLCSLIDLAQPIGELLSAEHAFNGDSLVLERKTGSEIDSDCIDPKAYEAKYK